MNTDLGTTVTTTGLLAEIPVTGGGTDSASFDCARGRWTLLVGVMGSAAGGDLTITVEDSANDSAFAAVSGVSTLTATAADKGMFTILIDHRKIRRYGRLNVVLESGGNTRVTVGACSFHGESGGGNGADLVIA